MTSRKCLILYYSGNGNTHRMAKVMGEAMASQGIHVTIKEVSRFNTLLLPNYDGILIGSPTYFSNVAWQVKKVIDESIVHYRGKKLKGKVVGIFTSAGTRKDGKDCLKILEVAFGYHHGMKLMKGILRVDGERDNEVEKRCQGYSKRLAREIKK